MKPNIFLIIAAILVGSMLLIGAGCNNSANGGTNSNTGRSTHQVTIQNFAFNPSTLTIKVGDTVTWTNSDGTTHTITSDSGTELSGQISQRQTYSHTFATAGTYAYHCSIHTYMHGTVIVQ